MQREFIEVHGARENNLKNVSVRIPKREITVFTGVSGSGKSSLVFDTLAAEAQRQLNETFAASVRNFLAGQSKPDVDAVRELSTAVVIDQKRIVGNARSTVGTITDIFSLLRLLFARAGEPNAGYMDAYSFNEPEGMCPECSGLGKKTALDLRKFFDTTKSLNEGAILHPDFAVGSINWQIYANSGLFDGDKKLSGYSDEEWEILLSGKTDAKVEVRAPSDQSARLTFEGVAEKFARLYINRDESDQSESRLERTRRFVTVAECPECGGARLNQRALGSRINGRNIAQMAAMDVVRLADVLRSIEGPVAAPMAEAAVEQLEHLVDVGLGYLTLDRETSTLSGGESQRIKMVRYLSSSLVDLMYVFDEPTVGLHPRDVHRLNEFLVKLREKGNTVLVVEHDPDVIAVADHVVDLGPGAGAKGGEIVYEGDVEGLRRSDTLTGEFMNRWTSLDSRGREPSGTLRIEDATLHNLDHVTVDVPLGVLTVVTGVAGSGKSTLVHDVLLERYPGVIAMDQSPLSTSTRSTPATYTGMMNPVRRLFARENEVSASLFSFNSKGACPKCRGLGVLYPDLAFMDPIRTTCDACDGRRFTGEVLDYTLFGNSISEVLDLTTGDALDFFGGFEAKTRELEELEERLRTMIDVGLEYMTLGQPLSSLSGGECQRLKLAGELRKSGGIYVLDEPTTGLHMADVGRLLALLDRLVDGGNSVIVIEHNLDVAARADHIIDLGPEGGNRGGEVVFSGTPDELLRARGSHTAEYLRASQRDLHGGPRNGPCLLEERI